jgi:hypothetical protein
MALGLPAGAVFARFRALAVPAARSVIAAYNGARRISS